MTKIDLDYYRKKIAATQEKIATVCCDSEFSDVEFDLTYSFHAYCQAYKDEEYKEFIQQESYTLSEFKFHYIRTASSLLHHLDRMDIQCTVSDDGMVTFNMPCYSKTFTEKEFENIIYHFVHESRVPYDISKDFDFIDKFIRQIKFLIRVDYVNGD